MPLADNRGFFSVAGSVDPDRIAVLEQAVEASAEGDEWTRARLLANLAGELTWSTDERRERFAEEALAIARRLGDRVTLGHVLTHRMPVLTPIRTEELVACVDDLAKVAAELGDPVLAFMSAWWGSINALTAGDIRETTHRLDVAAGLAAELRQPFYAWNVGFVRANVSRIAGDLALAESQALTAYEVGRAAGLPDARRVLGVNLFWIRHDQGRLEELADPLARAAARDGGALYLAALAFTHAQAGRRAEAKELIDRLAPGGFASMPTTFYWLYGVTVIAAACAAVGDRAGAAQLYERFRPWSALVAQANACATGTVAHHLGLLAGVLARYEDADEHFSQAAALNQRMGAPTWQAWTHLGWARVLVTRGRPQDIPRARELLGQAVATARELGMAELERRADALLADST